MAVASAKMNGPSMPLLVLLVLSIVNPAAAFWRLLCHGTLGTMRADPILSHGRISQHAHIAFGARNFGLDSTYETLMASNCTTCEVTQDRSVYWGPVLYFQYAENGSFVEVGTSGGIDVYYFNNVIDDATQLNAFAPGFQMIAGDATKRNESMCDTNKPMSFWNETDMTQECLAAKSLGFNCLDYRKPAEPSLGYHYLRNKTYLDTHCPDGMRAELLFPSCGNGALDSLDHKSHVLYPNLGKTGECPKGYEHRYPALFYETIYMTNAFVNVSGQFMFANGDPTGYGYHGDFINGWPQPLLEQALHTCTNLTGNLYDCPLFQLQDDANATSCKADMPIELIHEEYRGPIANLPGDMAIFSGPAPAVMSMSQTGMGYFNTTMLATYSSMPVTNTTFTSPASAHTSLTAFNHTSYGNTTSKALSGPIKTSPMTTTEPITSTVSYTTATSTYVSNGETVELILIEEVQMVTVEVTVHKTVTEGFDKHRRHHGHGQHGRGAGQL